MRSRYAGAAAMAAACLVLSLAAPIATSRAAENDAVGAGNGLAIDTSSRSPLVASAKNYILARAGEIGDDKLRGATLDAIDNPQTAPASTMSPRHASWPAPRCAWRSSNG